MTIRAIALLSTSFLRVEGDTYAFLFAMVEGAAVPGIAAVGEVQETHLTSFNPGRVKGLVFQSSFGFLYCREGSHRGKIVWFRNGSSCRKSGANIREFVYY